MKEEDRLLCLVCKMHPLGCAPNAWFFPVGRGSRIGVGAYVDETHLGTSLDIFLDSLGLVRKGTHGGYLPAALQVPTESNIFKVGDSAGQCLPLTGEGIRPAIYFGQVCGSIIQEILDGRSNLEEGLRTYRGFVMKQQRLYRVLRLAQRLVVNVPPAIARSLLHLACKELSLSYILPRYVGLADPNRYFTRPENGSWREETTGFSPSQAYVNNWRSTSSTCVADCCNGRRSRSLYELCQGKQAKTMVKDPVCGMEVDEKKAETTSTHKDNTYYFCAKGCKVAFDMEPQRYLSGEKSRSD